uniref:Uncharacterized protein n=1 Tax=Anguilla anguilla TaxID=7936 RepID=A0A0E9W9I5_ANGAN
MKRPVLSSSFSESWFDNIHYNVSFYKTSKLFIYFFFQNTLCQ